MFTEPPLDLTVTEDDEALETLWRGEMQSPTLANCLSRHGIKPGNREHMVDWLLHVLITHDCPMQAFFHAV